MQRSMRFGSRALSALLVVVIAALAAPLLCADEPAPPPPPQAEVKGPADAGAADSATVPAEAPSGVYKGKVTDRKGGHPVEGAIIVFTNEETSETFETVTDAKGEYEARLPAGDYLVDIKVGNKAYRSSGTFREEAQWKRWVMDFTVGSKLTEKDLKIETTPSDIRVVSTAARPPLEASKKKMELLIFLGGLIAIGALAN